MSLSDGGGAVSSAQVVMNAVNTAALSRSSASTTSKPRKSPPRSAIGTSKSNDEVKGVDTERKVHILASRPDPHTKVNELVDHVNSITGDLDASNTKRVKLNAKYMHLYSSSHVEIAGASGQFMQSNDLFTKPEAWPAGVLIRRYYKPIGLQMDNKANISVCTFNFRSVKNVLDEVRELLNKFDIVMLQEHWLLPTELCMLSELHSDFISMRIQL